MSFTLPQTVPDGWTVVPLGQIVRERNEKASDVEYQPLSVTTDGVVPQLDQVAKTSHGDNRKRVRAGDLVINSRSDRRGASGLADRDGSVSLISIVLEPIHGLPRFLHHLLRSRAFQEEFYRRGQGIVADLWTTRYPTMKRIEVALPPVPTQSRIADLLDRETARIDSLIEKKERLIALLEEKRSALITRAVTKGLDPDVPMKDSGVEWIGEIPEHWGLATLDKLVDSGRRITYGIVQPGEQAPDGVPMIRGKDYSNGWVTLDEIFHVSKAIESPYRRARVQGGDLLITIVGAGTGNVARVPEWLSGANITQTTARIAPQASAVDGGYLKCTLESKVGRSQVRLAVKGAAQPGLNLEHLAKFKVPVPPVLEQGEIRRALDQQTRQLASLGESLSRSITLLRERRSALITAAVTGQIDVDEYERSYRAPLAPDATDLEASASTASAAVRDA